jgi:hypothetical protein
MFSIAIRIEHLAVTALALVALTGGAGRCNAQRPEPHVVDFGLPASGEVVHGRLVQWGEWGVRADGCTRIPAGGAECRVTVLNGTAAEHALCLGDAALFFATAQDSTRMAIVRSNKNPLATDLEQRGYACGQLAAHSELTHTFRTTSPVAPHATSLGMTLVERLSEGNALKARTKLPFPGPQF